MSGYVIDWTAVVTVVGICVTAIIAVWQLRENSKQKAKDRELETKRDMLFDGVRGMTQAMQSFSGLANLNIDYSDSVKMFQVGMSQINVATCVAGLPTAKAGKEFIDRLGPLFMQAMTMRVQLEGLPGGKGHPEFVAKHKLLAGYILDSTMELGKSMLRAVAAVRTDVGIAKESEQQFLEVVYPNETLIKSVTDKVLGRDVPAA